MKKLFIFFFLMIISCIPENIPPTVELISPVEGAEFVRGDIIQIRVNAEDEEGDIEDVRLYVDEQGYASVAEFPYSFDLPTDDMVPGNHSIKVEAIDNYGKKGEATGSFLLLADLPLVTTMDPVVIGMDSAIVGGRILDNGGDTIIAAGVLWGTQPTNEYVSTEQLAEIENNTFTVTLKNLEYNTYYVTAFAENASGRSYGDMLSFTPFSLVNIPPSCEIITPAAGSFFTWGDDVEILADVSDLDGTIERVRLLLDSANIATLGPYPYSYSLPTTGMEIGVHTLQVEATDNAGGQTTDEVLFALNPALPGVVTDPPHTIAAQYAVLGGRVTSEGGGSVSEAGIFWGSEPYNGSNFNKLTAIVIDDAFTVMLDGLEYGTYYYMAYAENEVGRSYGEELSFNTLLPEDRFVDQRDGNVYKWIRIGTQIWMAENLAYLPELRNPFNSSNVDPFYYVFNYYGFKPEVAVTRDNYKEYGVLYNYPAAMDACPDGWHLPTIEEEQRMLTFIGGEDQVARLLESGTDHWNANPSGTNTSGFSARGAGLAYPDPTGTISFQQLKNATGWWMADTCATDTTRAVPFTFESVNPVIFNDDHCKPFATGYSVRCVKD